MFSGSTWTGRSCYDLCDLPGNYTRENVTSNQGFDYIRLYNELIKIETFQEISLSIDLFEIIIDYSASESRLEVHSENFWYSKINIAILARQLNIRL